MAGDVGIISPAVASSMDAARQALVAKKHRTYEGKDAIKQLEKQGITYIPLVASYFGSLHPTLDSWIKKLACAVGRKKGLPCAAVEKKIRSRIAAATAKRVPI